MKKQPKINIKLTLESYNQFKDSDKAYGIPKLFSTTPLQGRPSDDDDDFGDGTKAVFDQPVRTDMNSDLINDQDIDL